MQKLFSSQDKKVLSPVNKPEKGLQQFICENWQVLFPEYIFIAQEFPLKGAVHGSGSSGRIDILAYNPATKRFVVFELKKEENKYVWHQADNYRYYIKKNFPAVFVEASEKYNVQLPKSVELDKESEIVLIAKEFGSLLIEQAEDKNLVTLIEYNWYENDLLLLDYIHYEMPTIKSVSPQTPQQKTKEVDKIWKRIQAGTKTREENARKLTDPVKIEKSKAFFRIVHECIVAKDAKRLLAETTHPNRPFYKKNAERILDLEQNNLDK